MENILKIIYDLSVHNNLLDIYNIDKILGILIDKKDLSEYISSIDVQQIRSNNLASYSNCDKKIIVYSNVIAKMISDINKSITVKDQLTKEMYINLNILQVILHELEHANQEKIINYNTLEAFILRISKTVKFEKQIYEIIPSERFAEIKSYNYILKIIENYKNDSLLKSLIKTEELNRRIRGYHYCDGKLYSPITLYFSIGEKSNMITSFDWYSEDDRLSVKNANNLYTIEDCLFYGFPIYEKDYCDIMNVLIDSFNRNYQARIRVIKRY